MQHVRGIAGKKRHDVAGSDARWRVVLLDRALRPDRFVVQDNGWKCAATARRALRNTPWAGQRSGRTFVAELSRVVNRHGIGAGVGVGVAHGAVLQVRSKPRDAVV